MNNEIVVREVQFTAAPERLRASGLLGFVAVTFNDQLRLQGQTVRRTRGGAIAISFPRRKDDHGIEHAYIEPLNDEVRRAITRQISEAIGHFENAGR